MSTDCEDVLTEGWAVTADCSMDGILSMSVLLEDEELPVLTQAVTEGENLLPWDGTVDGERLPEGEYLLLLRLTDATGCACEPEGVTVIIEAMDDGIEMEDDDLIEEEPVLDAGPLPAHDASYLHANDRSAEKCSHTLCYWTMNIGEMDEDAIWQVLMQPITVISGDQRHQAKLRREPDSACTDYTGEVTYESQGVHVIRTEGEWSLVEAYSSSVEGSKVAVFAEAVQGWIKTKELKERAVDSKYGIVIDKLQQRLYVFKEGHLYSTLLCSTGFARSDTPFNETPAGEFITISWTGGFWSGNLFCDMGIRINDGILLHEVPCTISTA